MRAASTCDVPAALGLTCSAGCPPAAAGGGWREGRFFHDTCDLGSVAWCAPAPSPSQGGEISAPQPPRAPVLIGPGGAPPAHSRHCSPASCRWTSRRDPTADGRPQRGRGTRYLSPPRTSGPRTRRRYISPPGCLAVWLSGWGENTLMRTISRSPSCPPPCGLSDRAIHAISLAPSSPPRAEIFQGPPRPRTDISGVRV